MKKTFTIIFVYLCSLVCLFTVDTYAQSIHFSQFYNQPLLINPALTGSDIDHSRTGITYRNQWASIPAPYITLAGSYDMPILACKIKNGHFGLGAMGYRDASGDGVLRDYSGALSIAYHQTLTNWWSLSVGSQLGYTHKKVNFDKLTFPSQISNFQINPLLPNSGAIVSDSFGYFNAKFGLSTHVYINPRTSIGAGLSYNHIFPPDQTYLTNEGESNQLDGLWIFHATGRFAVAEDISIKPLVLHMEQGPNELNIVGATLGYHFNNNSTDGNVLNMGASYRFNDAVIFLVGLDMEKISINATYDYNVSDLDVATNNQGAIEVSLVYRGMTKNCD